MDTRNSATQRTPRRSILAAGLLTVGTLALVLGAFSSSASAWEGSCYDYAPSPGAWAEFRVTLADAEIGQLAGAGQTFDDGTLTVVLSGPTAADDSPLTVANIGAIDFSATPAVAAVYVRAGITTDNIYLYDEPVTTGSGLRATDATAPIEWLTFCYAPQAAESTTTTSTSTSSSTSTTSTTTLAPTSTVTQDVLEATTTTVPTEVLGQQVERPQQQLAFTGANSARLMWLGALLIVAGLAVTCINRVVSWRRTN